VVTVTALSTTGSNQPKYESGSDKPHLPMSQMLASRSPRNESGVLTGPTGMSSAGPTTSFVRTDAIVAAPQGVFSTQHQRISFRSFHISHLALFFLKSGKLPYVAFNEGAPHYYLSSESITAAKGDEKNLPAYICGEIIFIDTFQATEVCSMKNRIMIKDHVMTSFLCFFFSRISIHTNSRMGHVSMSSRLSIQNVHECYIDCT
jgi:hypothetical protein